MGDGWREILTDLRAEIASLIGGPDARPGFRISQVKEKYGEVSFYLRSAPAPQPDAIDAAVLRAEVRSRLTCKSCGAPGAMKATGSGYLYTTCATHIVG